MSGKIVMDRFIEKNPLAVMTRSIVGALMGEEVEEVFQENRSRQYDDTIKFSTAAMSMCEIALGTVKNRNQAYLKYKEELNASVVAFYGKLNRTELSISEGMVRYSPSGLVKCSTSSTFKLGKCCRDIVVFRSTAITCRRPRSG